MRIVFRAPILRDHFAALAARYDAEFVHVDDATALHDALASADALWIWPSFYDAALVATIRERSPHLRWIQLPTMGYDPVEAHGIPDGVTVTNAGDAYAPTVSEHAVSLLLALQRRLRDAIQDGAQRRWNQHEFGARIGTLCDATVVVLGFGNIGRATAERLRCFGTRIVAVNRSGRPQPLADATFPVSQLLEAVADCDALVVATPLTPQTRGIVSAAVFAALPPGAVLVNIARGALVDHDALRTALAEGRLGGAGLDVTDPEPLPMDDPLWNHPNVIITPHVAGYGGAVAGRRVLRLVERNLRHFLAGEPLDFTVTPSAPPVPQT